MKYTSEDDRELNLVTEAYQQWLVHDKMLFMWLLASTSETIPPPVIGYKHYWQVWMKCTTFVLSAQSQSMPTSSKTQNGEESK